MEKDKKARKWNLTINNPDDHGLKRTDIIERLGTLTLRYACFCYEVGKLGTEHVHIYLYTPGTIRRSTLKTLFPSAHIEVAYGKHSENRNYIRKEGKWEGTEKEETNLPETFWELNEIPADNLTEKEKREKLIEMVKAGMSNGEIIEEDSSFAFLINKIDEIRQTLAEERYMKEERELSVIYMFGATGTGKTRMIYDNHKYEDICRITNYKKDRTVNFDAYNKSQNVLVFEEFTGQIAIESMLIYLDRYPLMLPSRYHDKVACYNIVYFTSNVSLYKLYPEIQLHYPEVWSALLRRISKIIEFKADGTIIETDLHPKRGDKNGQKNKSVT